MSALPETDSGASASVPELAAIAASRPEFEQAPRIWSEVLVPELARRELDRRASINRAVRNSVIAALGVLVIFIALHIAGIMDGLAFNFPLMFFSMFVAVALFAGIAWARVFNMKSQTKQLILSAACTPLGFKYDTLHPNLEGVEDFKSLGGRLSDWMKYHNSGGGPKVQTPFGEFEALNGDRAPTPAYEILKAAGLFRGHSKSRFEDLITGERAGAKFALVEATLATSGKNSTTVFKGILVHIEYPERFLGRTLMARSGWWKRGRNAAGLKKVDLVSKELQRAFTVYSTDQVEARALLSPDRMERLIALERHFSGGKLRGVFEDGHMSLALEAGDQFEAGSIFKPLVDASRFTSALTELGLVCDLIDGFLTRDWVKGRL
ncbi:MAG: DUF3137 domain-containing protein [Alphaproteobacteria bacterium]|nr:hypothetical protein [Hyphomonas sp.]MBR9807522.1 DUF3137 domain-containing protein [Alphaproteobacteria bacterium]|tara:strand:+ start:1253 stop:2392 length:1140 start_codon:yes stop_codon:yes gene_type:complete